VKPVALRYLVDACLYVALGATTLVGVLLAFALPRGPEAPKYLLGLHRHAWMRIHYWLALFFVVLLVLHLLLNWRWIAASSKRFFGHRWKPRLIMLSAGWIAVVFVAWLIAYF